MVKSISAVKPNHSFVPGKYAVIFASPAFLATSLPFSIATTFGSLEENWIELWNWFFYWFFWTRSLPFCLDFWQLTTGLRKNCRAELPPETTCRLCRKQISFNILHERCFYKADTRFPDHFFHRWMTFFQKKQMFSRFSTWFFAKTVHIITPYAPA